jgi:hypothetical protein
VSLDLDKMDLLRSNKRTSDHHAPSLSPLTLHTTRLQVTYTSHLPPCYPICIQLFAQAQDNRSPSPKRESHHCSSICLLEQYLWEGEPLIVYMIDTTNSIKFSKVSKDCSMLAYSSTYLEKSRHQDAHISTFSQVKEYEYRYLRYNSKF